jgi:hypothetical protein
MQSRVVFIERYGGSIDSDPRKNPPGIEVSAQDRFLALRKEIHAAARSPVATISLTAYPIDEYETLMSVTVTMHAYSGRPDPTWQLTAQEEDELSERPSMRA